MATKIVTKNSSTASAVPTASDLVQGELAVNVADKRLFTEDNGGAIVELGTNPSTIDINAGTIDGTTIGASSASTGAFTTLTATGAFTSRGIDDNADAIAITIDSSENVGIGESSPSSYFSPQLVVHSSVNLGGITIRSNATTDTNYLLFADGTSGNERYRGYVSYDHNADTMKLATGASPAITIDSSQNVGIGVVPKTWYSASTALEIGSMSLEDYGVSGANVSVFANNLYRNASNAYVYKESDFAASYSQYNGEHTFNTAPSGTADSAATLTAVMKIDSSGNVLVGKTSADNTTAGTRIHPLGYASFTIANDYPIIANRLSSDGDIAVFRKDGATVGSIKADAGSVGIGSGNCGLLFYDAGDRIIPRNGTSTSDASLDLGATTDRFKDLYLSGVMAAGNGSAPAPSVRGTDTNTGLFFPSGGVTCFTQNGVERMRISSAGNVGIGNSSPPEMLTIGSTSDTNVRIQFLSSTAQSSANTIQFGNGTGTSAYSGYINYTHSDNALAFATGSSERMRINSAGSLMVNSTTNFGKFVVENGGNSYPSWFRNTSSAIDYPNRIMSNYATGGQTATMLQFLNASSAAVGAIKSTASATSYVTSSDQRLKENIADADDAGSKVDAIQVRKFDWKVDGSHQDYGMIAQELQAVAPEAVSGDADSEEMMGVDYSKLVPMLIKEIQSLRNRVAQLEE